MYYRARYYDPAVGRFISEDPLGFDAGDVNLYRYVFNSPTNYTDPSGELALTATGLGIFALGVGALALYYALQPEETRLTGNDLEDFAQWCLETVTGGYNPDFDPNRPIWDNLPLPQVDWGEVLQTPPVNLEDLYPGGFEEGPQPEIDDFGPPIPKTNDDELAPLFMESGPYSHLQDGPNVGPGKEFTATKKRRIYAENRQRNGGVLKDDETGELLVPPQRSQRGVIPPANEAQVDHIVPRRPADPNVAPGTNSYSNAQVISRQRNRQKSNR